MWLRQSSQLAFQPTIQKLHFIMLLCNVASFQIFCRSRVGFPVKKIKCRIWNWAALVLNCWRFAKMPSCNICAQISNYLLLTFAQPGDFPCRFPTCQEEPWLLKRFAHIWTSSRPLNYLGLGRFKQRYKPLLLCYFTHSTTLSNFESYG